MEIKPFPYKKAICALGILSARASSHPFRGVTDPLCVQLTRRLIGLFARSTTLPPSTLRGRGGQGTPAASCCHRSVFGASFVLRDIAPQPSLVQQGHNPWGTNPKQAVLALMGYRCN